MLSSMSNSLTAYLTSWEEEELCSNSLLTAGVGLVVTESGLRRGGPRQGDVSDGVERKS